MIGHSHRGLFEGCFGIAILEGHGHEAEISTTTGLDEGGSDCVGTSEEECRADQQYRDGS